MKINLLPKEERPLKHSEVRWGFLVGLIAVLLLGSVSFFSWIAADKLKQATIAHQSALSREAALQKQAAQVQVLRKDLAQAAEEHANVAVLLPAPEKSLPLLPALTGHNLSQLWVETVTWQADKVELKGYTRDITHLSRYLNHLNEHSEESSLRSISPYEDSGFSVFSIEAKGVGRDDSA